jgi:hypothetical protein
MSARTVASEQAMLRTRQQEASAYLETDSRLGADAADIVA